LYSQYNINKKKIRKKKNIFPIVKDLGMFTTTHYWVVPSSTVCSGKIKEQKPRMVIYDSETVAEPREAGTGTP
jgi:hypothetical protein